MDSRPVRIYSKRDVPRLRYIAGLILGDILGLSWDIITDKRKLGKHPVINYSDEKVTGSFRISPDTLLFEDGIVSKEITTGEWNHLPVFFLTSSESDLPFDIFAAAFFLVTRYEEYNGHPADEHGRFSASSSLAFKHGFLQIPIIDRWTKEMSKVFLKKFQTLVFKRNEYKSMVTIDTDQPFAYLGRGLLRSLGGLINDIKDNTRKVSDRYRIVAKGEKDPFEVFDYIIESIEKYGSEARFFFPVGDYSKYDKNPSWKNDDYRKLIHRLSAIYKTGLHPSYFAAGNSSLIKTETGRLKTILSEDIICSRFHFIRLFMPDSYRFINDAGITEDYSMGYPDEPGFRAGLARPFFFYDLKEDKQTNLRIVPFQIMDVTLNQYKNFTTEESKELILKILNETRRAGGLFVSIWHNTSLIDSDIWQGWRDVFEFTLKNQSP
jgi:hypothetical protein